MTNQPTIFGRIASLVRVRDIARPLGPHLDVSMSPELALDLLEQNARVESYDPLDRVSLIFANERPIGWVSIEMIATTEYTSLAEIANSIGVDQMAAADLPALSAVSLLIDPSSAIKFVLEGAEISGTLSYSDLFGAEFSLCLFALTLELEDSALRLLLIKPEAALENLTEDRLNSARVVAETRYGSIRATSQRNLLRSTTFIDKCTMIKKGGLIDVLSNTKLQSVFTRAERLRNQCAHPSGQMTRASPFIAESKMEEFLKNCQILITALNERANERRKDPP